MVSLLRWEGTDMYREVGVVVSNQRTMLRTVSLIFLKWGVGSGGGGKGGDHSLLHYNNGDAEIH